MKKMCILLLILFVSGCTVRYDLTINKDLSVDETIYGLENADFYNAYMNDTKQDIVYSLLDVKNEMLVKYKYNREYYNDRALAGAKLTRNFENFDDYINNTISYQHYFEKINYEESGNTIKLYSDSPYISYYPDDTVFYAIDSSDISIRVPFRVLKDNADECHIKNGISICTWKFDKTMRDKSIYLEFDKSVSSKKVALIYYGIIGLIIVGVILILYSIFNVRVKMRNSI